ncbi:hypothetical protein B0J11DRAFT_211888 [Dendryphion nanum]|uniref:TPR-like protein n=1 Tax=Dendryphion nanum TaxID=256645 RepID=A0A9P9E5X6_9PLEO|nr:hypothetical protein B0J11DRAFT_211888 [Dendryphion nanum]
MAELVGLAASIVTLIATARAINNTFTLIADIRDCPKEIDHLHKEHDSLIAALQSLDGLIISSQAQNPNPVFVDQVKIVVGDTAKTLTELQATVTALQPSRMGKRGAVQIRCKYFWKERTIQSILVRIQARRDALTLLLNMWQNSDAQEMKRQLDSIKHTLEACLANIHVTPVAPEASAPLSPMAISSGSNESSEVGSSIAPTSPDETGTSFTELSHDNQPVMSLARRFDRALNTGRASGPQGENIKRLTARFNATKIAAIGAAAANTEASSLPIGGKGKAPASNKIYQLAQSLVSQEASTPGLWSKESTKAAEALALAYEDVEDFESALEYLHIALSGREVLLGSMHVLTLNTADQVARVFELQFRWQDALEYYELSLLGRSNNPSIGTKHPSYIPTVTRVGRMHHQMGELDLALKDYNSILGLCTSLPGTGGLAIMTVKAEVAKIHLQKGDMKEGIRGAENSISEFEKLLDSREAKFGKGHKLAEEVRVGLESVKEALTNARKPVQSTPTSASAPTASLMRAEEDTISNTTSRKPEELDSVTVRLHNNPQRATDWGFEIEEYEKRLEEARKQKGDHHPATLELMCNLADAYESHEQYEAAISWFLEALRGQEITLGEKHPATLGTVHNLGVCYASNEDYGSSFRHLHRAVTGRTMKLAKNHPDTLSSMVQLATIHQMLGEYREAIEVVQKAIVGLTERYNAQHPLTLSAEFKLGKILQKKGDLAAAQKLHEKVLHDRESRHLSTHPQVLDSKYELGVVFRELEDNPRAIALFFEAYEGQKTTFGPHHSITIGTALSLAKLYWETEQWQNALNFYLIVQTGLEKGHGASPTAGCIMMHNIATCYIQMDKHEDAMIWFQKVHKIYEIEFGAGHDKTIAALVHVARECLTCEKFDEAIGYYSRILRVKEQSLPDSDETVMLALFHLFRCTSKNGQNEKALSWGKRYVDIGETTNLEWRIVVMRGIGNIYAGDRKYTEAMDWYHKALNETPFLGDDHWLPSNIACDVQRLYVDMDNGTKAIQDLQKQRDIISQLLISDPRSGASLLVQLGFIHSRQHMHHESLNLLEEALEAIQGFPSDSDFISLKHDAISGIADAHLTLYNNQAAMVYLQMLAESEEDDRYKLNALVRIASALEQEGEFEKSIERWKQVRREEERKSGLDSLDVLRTARKIGSMYLKVKNTHEALRWTQGTVAGLRRCTAPEAKMEEISTLSLMASIHLELGDYQSALSSQRDCATGLAATVGEGDEKTLGASLDLAEIYNMLGNESEAKRWYKKAIRGYKDKLGGGSVKVLNAERRLRELERT